MKKKTFHSKTERVGGVSVGIYPNGAGFRIRCRCNGEDLFDECFRPDQEEEAKTVFEAKKVYFANLCRPPSASDLAALHRKAALIDSLEKKVSEYGSDVSYAVDTFCSQIKEFGSDGVRLITHLFGPRIFAIKPHTVDEAIAEHTKWSKAFDQVSESHRQNQGGCLRKFATSFGKRLIHTVSAAEIADWLVQCKLQNSTWNSHLYTVRDMFEHARDFLKALPGQDRTEPDLIPHKKVKNVVGPIYTVDEFKALLASVTDRELLLAVLLVGKLHLRESEAEQLEGEDFHRPDGIPQTITLPSEKAKGHYGEWVPRDIPIPSSLQPLLKEILPPKGPLFPKPKRVFRRLRALQKALGKWAKNILRRTCCTYGVASGASPETVAVHSGHTVEVQKKHYLASASHVEGLAFRDMVFDVDRLKKLPEFAKTKLEQAKADESVRNRELRAKQKKEKSAQDESTKQKLLAEKSAVKARAIAKALAESGQTEMFPLQMPVKEAA